MLLIHMTNTHTQKKTTYIRNTQTLTRLHKHLMSGFSHETEIHILFVKINVFALLLRLHEHFSGR